MSSTRKNAVISSDDRQNFKMIWRVALTGLSHHDYALVAQELEVGDELTLEPIMANSYDPEAVAVKHEGEQIGWLPAKEKAAKGIIHRMLRNDVDLRVKIISHDRSAGLDNRLYVGIYIRLA